MAATKAAPSNVHYYSPRLLRKLAEMFAMPVTVIEAPSGHGKTTAVRDYLKKNLSTNTVLHWWNAEESSAAFSWARLCREFTRIDEERGMKLVAAGFPNLTNSWEIAALITDLRSNTPAVLVLDDFQFLQKELPRTVVSALLTYNEPNLKLIIITQTIWPFERAFFAKMNVHYIHTNDLQLHVDDIRRYYKLCGISISEAEAFEIYKFTEGWIVALYLTMLQLKRGEGLLPGLDIIRLMDDIIWKSMNDRDKEILLHFAPFPDVTTEQICFLLQSNSLQEGALDLLARTPFISYEAEGRRYVFHAILQEMLQSRLELADITLKTDCYKQAGRWYAEQHQNISALSCFLKVKDYESVLSLPLTKLTMVRVEGVPFTQQATKFLAECPQEVKRRYPISLLRIAYAFFGADQREAASALMQEIRIMIEAIEDEAARRELLGEWTLISAFEKFPDIVKMEPIIHRAAQIIGGRCQTITAQEPFAFGMPLMVFFYKRAGGMAEVLSTLTKVVEYLTLLTGVNSGADVQLETEWAFYRGDVKAAELLAYRVIYLTDKTDQWSIRTGAVSILAEVAFKRGSNASLTRYTKALEESVGRDAHSQFVNQLLQADYFSWTGLVQLTAQWIREGKMCFPDAPTWFKAKQRYAHLVVLLQEGEYTRLLGAAEAAIVESRQMGYLMAEMYNRLVAAIGYFKIGQLESAFNHVQAALASALEDEIFLPFMELKWLLGDLVDRAFSALGVKMPEEVISEGQAFEDNWKLLIRHISEKAPLPYGLTEQEMKVATMAAKGMSNKEIARGLFISETTVKFHLRSVFSKLDIDRRSKLPGLLDK
ncbi:MAG: LuxR C-terminal-related transcriptional regulator [Bacillota bacterium]